MWAAFLARAGPAGLDPWTVVIKGGQLLLDVARGGPTPSAASPRADVGGGAVHAILGTLHRWRCVTAVIAVPIGVLTAIYLVEYGRGRLARAVSFMVDILTGVPSIVAALFIYALWVTTFGFQRVGFAVVASRWCC